MSLRIDTTSWIPGALVIGNTGLGVLGANIASSGTDGAGYAFNDISLPADAAKEICGRITTLPSGTLYTNEDTSGTYTGATSTAQYQLYVDGVATGSPTPITFSMGTVPISPGTGTMTFVGYAPTITLGSRISVYPQLFRGNPNAQIAIDLGFIAILADGSTSQLI